MTDTPQCIWCIHYRAGRQSPLWANPTGPYCAIEQPLVPCKFYEREVGSDDD